MPEIPILGQTDKEPMQNPTYESLTPEQRARLADMADQEEPEGRTVQTAFLVIQDHDGTWSVDPDVTTVLQPARPASSDDVVGGSAVVVSDLQTSQTAHATAGVMMQMSNAMQQQAQTAALQRQLQHPGGRLRV